MSDIIVVATSGAREEYRRDFLHALGAPEGMPTNFSYRKRWIEPDVLNALGEGPDSNRALIVFVEDSDAELRINPVRWATIAEVRPHKTSQVHQDDHIVITLELQEFFGPESKNWDAVFADWALRIGAGPLSLPEKERHHVFLLDKANLGLPSSCADACWARLASRLRRTHSCLGDAHMFRVSSLLESSERPSPVKSDPSSGESTAGPHYVLEAGRQYRLDVQHDGPHGSGADLALTVASPAPWLSVTPPVARGYGHASKAVVFLRADVDSTQLTALTVQPRTPRDELPSHQLALVIEARTNNRRRLWSALLLAASLAIAGILSASNLGFGSAVTYLLIAISALLAGYGSFTGLSAKP